MNKSYQRLPDSELDIMLALWTGESEMGRNEIEQIVNEKKNLAPTTILSLLTRLEKKGFVSIRKEGKINLYSPLVKQEEYQQNESKSVLEKLYGNSIKNFVASLYRGKEIDDEDIQELNDFIKDLENHEG
ncbi:MAG: BlaI/MecI/CopY family transcriptional regulator [Lachnospiraceae bacterium]|nr:BlaI/MecI/CopY family transcriptional regulator [Lachnospiraceae bacterium]MDD3616147.1 BlaI/MecI/CopY family transcriptional regulator [Lachnospiraceae bacterium]